MATLNELITKLASKQAQLIDKSAECTVLRNQIAELKIELKKAKPTAVKPAVKPKATTKKPARKGVKK